MLKASLSSLKLVWTHGCIQVHIHVHAHTHFTTRGAILYTAGGFILFLFNGQPYLSIFRVVWAPHNAQIHHIKMEPIHPITLKNVDKLQKLFFLDKENGGCDYPTAWTLHSQGTLQKKVLPLPKTRHPLGDSERSRHSSTGPDSRKVALLVHWKRNKKMSCGLSKTCCRSWHRLECILLAVRSYGVAHMNSPHPLMVKLNLHVQRVCITEHQLLGGNNRGKFCLLNSFCGSSRGVWLPHRRE